MGLPREQRVSDALHRIAELVQEADSYLCESALFKSTVKPLPKSKVKGFEPHKASRIELRDRKLREKIDKPMRDVFPARRERKARHRYHALKGIETPRKILGSRLRSR
jgi:hypothetical protein